MTYGPSSKGITTNVAGATGPGAISAVAIDPGSCVNVALSPFAPQYACTTLYAGGAGSVGTVWKSLDGGATWAAATPNALSPSTTSLAALKLSSSFVAPAVLSLAVNPNNSKNILAGTDVGVYQSIDGGITWVESSLGMNVNAVPTGTGAAVNSVRSVNAFAFDPVYSSKIYAATSASSSLPTGGGVWKSIDGGRSWTQLKIQLGNQTSKPTSGGSILQGSTWALQNIPEKNMASVAVDPKNPNIVWANRITDTVYFSLDGGLTWRPWTNPDSLNPAKSAYNSTIPGGTSLGDKDSTNIYIDASTTPSTVYIGSNTATSGGGAYVGSIGISPIDGVTPVAPFTQLAADGLKDTQVSWIAFGPLGLLAGAGAPSTDAFVAELDPNGAKLLFATYLGGPASAEDGNAISVDSKGNIYAAGRTSSKDFPTKSPWQKSRAGGREAFVVKYKP